MDWDGFEWDVKKAASNRIKHGVGFDEAATMFFDPWSLTVPDPDHSAREARFVTIGYSSKRRILTVVHVDRGHRIRIISARRATSTERNAYEKGENGEG